MASDVPPPDFASSRAHAHAWRGECLNRFAEVEYRLASLLIRASGDTLYGKDAAARSSADILRKLAGGDGPLAKDSGALLAALADWERFDELRHFLIHAVLTVAVTEEADTIFILRLLARKDGAAEQSTLTLYKHEIDGRRSELERAADALKAQIEAAEKALAVPATSIRSVASTLPAGDLQSANGRSRRSLPGLPIPPR